MEPLPQQTFQTLPTNREELQKLISDSAELYGLTPDDDIADAVATAIMHIPTPRAIPTLEYFGEYARQAVAKREAYNLLAELRQKREAKKAPPESAPDGQPVQNA